MPSAGPGAGLTRGGDRCRRRRPDLGASRSGSAQAALPRRRRAEGVDPPDRGLDVDDPVGGVSMQPVEAAAARDEWPLRGPGRLRRDDPDPPGIRRETPSMNTVRWAWMWNASCSPARQLISSTVWPSVGAAGAASSGPAGTGTPSRPSGLGAPPPWWCWAARSPQRGPGRPRSRPRLGAPAADTPRPPGAVARAASAWPWRRASAAGDHSLLQRIVAARGKDLLRRVALLHSRPIFRRADGV